eukprot:SAG31_NODE_3912_length_3756_cov_2.368205_1_plen_167_part_00
MLLLMPPASGAKNVIMPIKHATQHGADESAATAARQELEHQCVSDQDCYGGKCLAAAGKCLCPPIWTGPTCQILRLKPARASTPGLLLPKTSTWGGGAVEDEAGQWHMFAAQIKAHCGEECYFLVLVGLFVLNFPLLSRFDGTLSRNTGLIEKVSPCRPSLLGSKQ